VYDLKYEHVWYIDPSYTNGEKVWAVKMIPAGELEGTKDMGFISPNVSDILDVIFISYNEPNASDNWKRVLEKAPYAKRIDGVKGIFEAHKAAARMAKSDMFYVVDGDAYLTNDWKFDNTPNIYDRDCVHVYKSINPINDLVYGYGGVKIFPRTLLLNAKTWGTDMTTSIADKLKVIDKISNITAFNTDEVSTWRSAFRECAKLAAGSISNQNDEETIARLEVWLTKGDHALFGHAALVGAMHGVEYAKSGDNINNINDREWLNKKYKEWKEDKTELPIKNVICPVPWTHLNFEPNGKVVPCCLTSTYNYFAGDLTTQSLEEIWNSDNMKSLRKDMIDGVEPKICSKCFDRERVTGESGRTYHIKYYPEVMKAIPSITLPDGTCTTMELKYWDFRFSNLCNFKCRSCGPRYSSSWVPDAKKLGYTDQEKVWNIDTVDNKTNVDFLKDQIQYVEKIYFAGGEPLLMPEHWEILEMLVENKRFDVQINYNTNCSTLTYGGKNVLDYWKLWKFGKIEVWPSIDEIGERAELLRSGTVWSKVEHNIKEIIKLDNVIVRPGITVGAWNVNRLPEIITHFAEIGILKEKLIYRNFFFNLLEDPKHYHVHILPDEFREATIKKLETFIKEFSEKYKTDLGYLFTHIIHELKKPFNLDAAKRFLHVTEQLDNLRDEKLMDVIPEMKCIENLSLVSELKRKVIPIIPVKDEPENYIASPVIYDSKKLIEIDNKGNSAFLTWILNNICTNHCSYCPPAVHNGSNHNYDWSHAEKFVNECFNRFKTVHCSISGGEPTVSPFFKDLINLIYDKGGSLHLTTNLVKPLSYWTDITTKFDSIAVSYHPEFTTTTEQENALIEKIKYIAAQTWVSVRVMMLPSRWDQCYKFYLKLIENKGNYGIELVRILPNFGVGENYCIIDYSPEQDNILNSTSIVIPTTTRLRRSVGDAKMIFENGSPITFTSTEQIFLENNNLANFKNWSCDIGLESLFVHYDGNIQRANCGVGGFVGNITKMSEVVWPTESIICNKSICHCAADLIISKKIL
jgi:radical SAM protein with 4Fe4S-binding SPASM domain